MPSAQPIYYNIGLFIYAVYVIYYTSKLEQYFNSTLLLPSCLTKFEVKGM